MVRVPGLMIERSCFRGTRVPVETLFVNLAEGDTIAEVIASLR